MDEKLRKEYKKDLTDLMVKVETLHDLPLFNLRGNDKVLSKDEQRDLDEIFWNIDSTTTILEEVVSEL